MAKKKRRKSAVVPAVILSAGLMTGAAVVPMLSGCGGSPEFTVACECFGDIGFTVAIQSFDMSVSYPDGFSVAKQAFDLSKDDISNDDAEPKDAG